MEAELLSRLDRIERTLGKLLEKEQPKEWYTVEEFAALVDGGRAPFTVREWARLKRINATKKKSGRGQHFAWVISHEELLRYQKDGLLPLRSA